MCGARDRGSPQDGRLIQDSDAPATTITTSSTWTSCAHWATKRIIQSKMETRQLAHCKLRRTRCRSVRTNQPMLLSEYVIGSLEESTTVVASYLFSSCEDGTGD